MRQTVNLYRDAEKEARDAERRARKAAAQQYRDPAQMDEDEGDEAPVAADDDGLSTDYETDDGSDAEFPRVEMDELLDDIDEMNIEE